MSMKNQAIYSLYPKAVSIGGNAKIILDANDKDITDTIDMKAVEAKAKELQADYDAKEYQRDRAIAYKELKEQFDLLYHDMVADKGDKTGEWFKHIKAVKDANPKT